MLLLLLMVFVMRRAANPRWATRTKSCAYRPLDYFFLCVLPRNSKLRCTYCFFFLDSLIVMTTFKIIGNQKNS